MDRFAQLEAELTAAAVMVSTLVRAARRSGQLPALDAELRPFLESLSACVEGPVTEEFIEAALRQYNRALPVLMAALPAEEIA